MPVVSVSSVPELGGSDSAPSSPSGVPVLKKNGSAQAGVASPTPKVTVAATRLTSRGPAKTSASIRLAKNVHNLVVVHDRFMKSSSLGEGLQVSRETPLAESTQGRGRPSALKLRFVGGAPCCSLAAG